MRSASPATKGATGPIGAAAPTKSATWPAPIATPSCGSVSQKFQLKTVYEPETCFQCHKDRRAQMARSSHMPLREGKMVCSDCHQPHGTANEALLQDRYDQ